MDISKKLPKFKSIEEEAEFWDTHDITDLSPLTEEDMEETITIRVLPGVKYDLTTIAKKNGLSVSALTRLWLIDRLSNYKESGKIQ